MSDDAKDWRFQARKHAQTVVNRVLSTLGECICRASAYSKDALESEVYINIENEKLDGGLYHGLIEEADRLFGWTPELIAHIKATDKKLRQRLSETLYYFAREYFIVDVGEEGEEYGIYNRH